MKKSQDVDTLAKMLWEYHHMNHQVKKADCIFVLGSQDKRVAHYAIDLFFRGFAPYILFSGGFGRFTNGVFDKTEAKTFADIALARGIPEDKIIIENKSTNTGQNIEFSKEILRRSGFDFNSFILVQKPYMERRAYATFKKIWPEKDCIAISPKIPFEEYPTDEITKDSMINIMVGDLQRIKAYSEKGFQIYQAVPSDVLEAYQKLISLGYTKQLIKD